MHHDQETPRSGDERSDAEPGRDVARPWRRLDATLVYDSRLAPPVAGMRSAKAGFPRLIFQAAGYEVALQVRLSPTAGRLRVLGQVLDDAYEPCSGWIVIEGSRGFVKTGLDECGHFSIDGLPSGGHWMEVELPHARITLPPVYI